ncbi:MAG: tetratricopeptide repeat protein [Candidatus Binatia bacterium]
MSIFSKLFSSLGPEDEKKRKFREFEKGFHAEEMINLSKAVWLTSRGNHYGEQGNLDQAIADFREAIELKLDHSPAYISLGIAYREKGMFREALEILHKAPRKMTAHGQEQATSELLLYATIATVYLLMGDKVKSLEYARRAVESANEWDEPEMIEMAEQIIRELEGE